MTHKQTKLEDDEKNAREAVLEAQRFGIRTDSVQAGTEPVLVRAGICSYGGAGKTQLMLKYAWDNRKYYSGGVFWVEADTAHRIRRDFIGICKHLGKEGTIGKQAHNKR